MSKEPNIVIIAAYPTIEPATKDFDQLVQLVKDKKVKTDGMILVKKDAEGNLSVSETGDHLGRKGMGWGGAVGFLVGLAAPPLLASVAVGAAAGALVGKFAKQKVVSGMEEGLGDKLKPGTALILAIVREEDRLTAEMALPDSPAKSVATINEKGKKGLQDALGGFDFKWLAGVLIFPLFFYILSRRDKKNDQDS